MSTMAGRSDRFYIFTTSLRRLRVPQDQTTSDALLDAFAAAHSAVNLVVETGPPSKPATIDEVRRYDGKLTKLVSVTDADGTPWSVRPGDLIPVPAR